MNDLKYEIHDAPAGLIARTAFAVDALKFSELGMVQIKVDGRVVWDSATDVPSSESFEDVKLIHSRVDGLRLGNEGCASNS